MELSRRTFHRRAGGLEQRRLGAVRRRSKDWSQAHDLAADLLEKLAELQQLFIVEAAKNNVFPIDDRRQYRWNSELAMQ